MKILHITQTMGQGGAERHLANLFKYLHEDGVTNEILTLWPGEAYHDQIGQFASLKCLHLNGRNILAGLPRAIRLAKQADVIHTQLFWADLLGRLAGFLAGRPVFTTLQTSWYDKTDLTQKSFIARQKMQVLKLLDLITSRFVDHFFAVSAATQKAYMRALRLPEEDIEILYNTVELSKFNPDIQGDREAIRARLGISPNELLLFTTARLIPTKRIEDAICATNELSRRMPIRLLIAGAGPSDAELQALIEQLQAPAQLLGPRDDVPALLFAADLFVFPSILEGLPLALIEAMAMGLPCVCADIPENREVCGDAAVYYPPTDLPALIAAIESLAHSKEQQASLSEQARAAVKKFDAQLIAKKFLQSIQERAGRGYR